jgi:hypothetical protein
VYLIYGLHHCMNVVTEAEGQASAVLIRAIEPIANVTGRAAGPGLVCRALHIDLSCNGHDRVSGDLFIAPPADPIALFRLPSGPAVHIARASLESGVMPQGSRRDFELRLRAPRRPGRYLLQLDMVDERVHWFSDLGWPGLIHELEVVPSE